MTENSKKITTDLGWAFSERLLAQFISLVVSVILARILDPDHYGIISLVSVFITILDAFVSGGFGNALVQKKDADDLDFNTICWFSIFFSLLLYSVLFILSPYISNYYKMDSLCSITRIMGVRIIVSSFNSVQHAYVQRKMQFRKFFFSTLGGTLISAVVGIVMALNDYGVWALVSQYLVNSIIDTIVLLFAIDWKPKFQFSFERLKIMCPFGFRMMGATVVNTFNDSFRSLLIGKHYSTEDLAYYNQGKKYPAFLMNNLISSIQKVFFPAFSKEQDDREHIKALMRTSIRISSYLLLPVIIGIVATAETFIVAVLTEKWVPCIPYLRILSLIYVTRTANTIMQSSLLGIGKSKYNLIHEVVGTVLSIVLVLMAVFIFDSIKLVAWSYVVTMVIGTGIFVFFVHKEFNYRFYEMFTDFIPYVLISVLMGLGVFFIGRLPVYPILLLIIQVIAGVFFYLFISHLFGIKEQDYFFAQIKRIINYGKNKRVNN